MAQTKFKQTEIGEIPEAWKVCRLSEISETQDFTANGSFASLKENVKYYDTPNHAVLVRLTDYSRGFDGDFVYIDEHAYNFLKKSRLKPKDLIISNIGAYAGTVFLAPSLDRPMSLGPNAITIKNTPCNDFLFYWLKSSVGQGVISSIKTGSAVPKFNKTDLRGILVPQPPVLEQKAIANILGDLDEKIELNNRMNKTLEAMGQALFKRWFMDFEFPGEKGIPYKSSGGKMMDSELGEIPDGWECKSASRIADIFIGRTPPRKEPHWFSENIQDVRWVSIKDMGSQGVFLQKTSEYLTGSAIDGFNVPVVPDNTVLLSFKLTIGRVAIADGEMVTNEAIANFQPLKESELSPEYVYFYLKNFDYLSLGSTSSIASAVNSTLIKEMRFLIPRREIHERFLKIANGNLSRIKAAQRENIRLEMLRDSLLPKLMSGEIRV